MSDQLDLFGDDLPKAEATRRKADTKPCEACRSCGAPIIWMKSVRGKWIPLNHPKVALDKPGKLYNDFGELIDHEPEVEGWLTHFATCPQATKWRKSD